MGQGQVKDCASKCDGASRVVLKEAPHARLPELAWEDFQGNPDSQSSHYAHAYWKVTCSYTVVASGKKIKLSANAKCEFEKEKAWVIPEHRTQKLLEHEQGHYHIGCLCAMTLNKRVKKANFTKSNYKNEFKEMFKKTLKEFLELEKKYDDKTNHCCHREKQKEWEKMIQKKFKQLQSY